jgi:endonuclease/exonuclease/phosphatase (EEP) superfamily protein YafD
VRVNLPKNVSFWRKSLYGSPQAIAQRFMGVIGLLSLAGYLGAWHQYLELTSHFKVQYFWLSMVGSLIFLQLHRTWRNPWVLISLFCIGLNGSALLPWYWPQPKPSGQPLRAIVVNVLTENRRYDDLIAWVRSEQPTVLMTMEVNAEWTRRLAALQPMLPYSYIEAREDNFGIAIYSALPLQNARLQQWNDGDLTVPSLVTDLVWQGQPLTVVATHPLPPTNADYFQARNAHLREMAQDIQRGSHPTIVLGDLNLSMWSPFYQKFVQQANLHNSRQGFGIQPTWGHRTGLLQIPIDHCLVSPTIGVQNNRIGPDIGSDHRPMIADLVVLR